MLITFAFILLQLLPSAENDITEQSLSQAESYVSAINANRNVDANLWALTRLGDNSQRIRSYVQKALNNADVHYNYLSSFGSFEASFQSQLKKIVFKNGSPNLLIALLLSTPDKAEQRELVTQFMSKFGFPKAGAINHQAICESIIQDEQITAKFLPVEQFSIIHFFLLFDENYKTYLKEEYLNQIAEKWDTNYSGNRANIHSSLKANSYFRVLYLQDQYSKILPLYNQLVSVQSTFPNSSLKLRIFSYLDYSMFRLGYYDRSIEIARKYTLPLANTFATKAKLLSIKMSTGTYLYYIGKVKEANNIYQEVIKEAEDHNVELPKSIIYNNLALTYYKTGQYEKYLELQFQALDTAQKEEKYDREIEIYNNLFIYFRKTNDERKAFDYLQKALKTAQKEEKNEDLVKIYTSLGALQREFKKDFKKAHFYYSKAYKIAKKKNDFRFFLELINEQAEAFEQEGKYSKALEKHQEILTISKKSGPNYLEALINKAQLLLEVGNTQKFQEILTEVKGQDLNQLDFEQIIKFKTVEANYLAKTNHAQQAIELLSPALNQIVERAQSSSDLKSGFWHVEDEYHDAFELAVSIYTQIGNPTKAVQKLDQLKTINDASLYQNPLVKSSLLNESELTQYKRLTQQLDVTRKKLLTAPESKQLEIRQTISRLKLKKRKLDRKLTNQAAHTSISIREVQKKLSAHEITLHITELKNKFYVAQISRSRVDIRSIALDSQLRQLLSGTMQEVATRNTNLDSLFKISQRLGFDTIPEHIEKITVIPDSYFYQLPMGILPVKKPVHSYSYGQVQYLIEDHQIQYLTSLSDFANNTGAQKPPTKFSYVGYGVSEFGNNRKKSLVPLPFAQKEVRQIADRLTNISEVKTFVNEQSTKETFTKTAPEAGLLHLATHSEVSDRDPMFSSIYLSSTKNSADSTYDDQIFAYELFELNLNNEMIMLNSCESGSGSYIQGTGVMGISRALRYAGARSLILNLWSVNDMLASDFAIHFYDQLNQGKSKSEALQASKKYFLRTKNADPHYWGSYMLIGDTKPIIEPDREKNILIAGSFIGYFLLMIGLSYLHQQGIILQRKPSSQKAA